MKHDPREFEARQYMLRSDLEAFYYSDRGVKIVPSHQHSFTELLLLLEGKVSFRVGDEEHTLLPGDLLVVPGDVPHCPLSGDSDRYRRVVIWLTESFVRTLPDSEAFASLLGMGGQQARIYRFRADDSDALEQCAMAVADELRFDRPMGDTMTAALITQLLIRIRRSVMDASEGEVRTDASAHLIRDITAYIDENLHRDLTLDALSERFFFSKFYLSRLFKQHMNLSPHAYITRRRLLMAKQLLYEGLPPTEVYRRCGYSDYSVFFRSFRKFYGVAPGQFPL